MKLKKGDRLFSIKDYQNSINNLFRNVLPEVTDYKSRIEFMNKAYYHLNALVNLENKAVDYIWK